MSKPEVKATMYNVVMEIGSASSSLHCPPDPIEDPHPEAMFLDELDHMCQHSMEHIYAASRSICEIRNQMERLYEKLGYQERGFGGDLTLKDVRRELGEWVKMS